MMKVGLFTCFIDNYGACLQAYAMQTQIESFGADCSIINYVEPKGYRKADTIKDKLKKNKLTYFIMSCINKNYKMIYCKIKPFNMFRKKYLHLTSKTYYHIDQVKNDIDKYDCYVCGSDQIWNPVLFDGNNLAYTLGIVPDDVKKVAYAPSIGLPKFPEEYKKEFKTLVDRIDIVSVREQAGVDIINDLIPNKARLVLDPTLLLNKDDWNKIAKSRYQGKNYILVYMFGDRQDLYDFIDLCAKKTGLEVVVICVAQKNINNNYTKIYNASPEEFIGLIRDAKLVVTDSFHATAFSINMNTPFYSLLRCQEGDKNNMNSRIFSILDLCQLQDRLVTTFNEDFIVDYNMDFDKSNKLLDAKRKGDTSFFREAIING